mgnify:CR=1 FL=1
MATKTDTKIFDGVQVTSVQLPAMLGYDLLNKVGEVFSPALAALKGVEVDTFESLITRLDVSALGPPLMALFGKLNAADKKNLPPEILAGSYAMVEGVRVDLGSANGINIAFEGKLLALFQAMAMALKVNFADLFVGVATQMASVVTAARASIAASAKAPEPSA